MTDFPTSAEVAREALEALEATATSSYQYGFGARLVMPHLYHGGIHNPSVHRATNVAGIEENQVFNVSRQVGRDELVNWIGNQRLLPRSVIRGMLELHDDALYDYTGVIDPESVAAAAENVKRFGRMLRRATEKDFLSFPYPSSSRKYMTAEFAQNWTGTSRRRRR